MDENEDITGDARMRVVAVVGIRSQYIKLCALQRMLKKNKQLDGNLEMIYVNAGQHYDFELSDGFIDELDIKFDETLKYDDTDPIHIFSDMIYKLCAVYRKYDNIKPIDYVMVFGDANTTMAATIAASKVGIKVTHVEAGLRLGNLNSPEEGNRIVADHLSTRLYVSNKADWVNIEKEGLTNKSFFAGDIIQDLVLDLKFGGALNRPVRYLSDSFHLYKEENYVLASMHRKENIKSCCIEPLFRVLGEIEQNVIFLAHPTVLDTLRKIEYDTNKITVVKYIPYYDMLACINKCCYLITDSGAFQREAYYLGKRCLIRQDVAFWQHLVDIGAHFNIGSTYEEMSLGIKKMNTALAEEYPNTDFFGNGTAVEQIIRNLMESS